MPLPKQPIEKACEICTASFLTRNRRTRTCGRSCANVLSWRNPGTKEKRGAGISKAMSTPKALARVARFNRERWARPGERDKLSEWNRANWSDPAFKAERAKVLKELWKDNDESKNRIRDAAVQRWRDPEFRAHMSKLMREVKNRPEVKAAFSEWVREKWKIPAWRKAWLDRQRKYAQDPNIKAQNSERMKEKWRTDRAFRNRVTTKGTATKTVRNKLVQTIRAMADSTGCFEACENTLAAAIKVNREEVAVHMKNLEKRGLVMLARPAGNKPALYQLL